MFFSGGASSHGSLSIDVRFDRANKTYVEGEVISGCVIVMTKSDTKVDSLLLEMEGAVRIHTSGKSLGVIDAISNQAVKSINLAGWSTELSKSATILSGKTEFPFSFELKPNMNRQLYESYHGVYLAVQYAVKCDMKRPFPQKALHKAQEFLVQYTKKHQEELADNKPVAFTITPESVHNRERLSQLPKFTVTGKLDSSSCLLSKPLTGEVTVHKCDIPIKSIELQLLRAETCGSAQADGANIEYTEVQTLQIADGDVARGISIPIYMVFPRLFACSTTDTPNFKIEFELALVLIFHSNHMIKEVFPLTLHRW
uniref:Uncharacterized protein n=1 Tax=Plectus sambesii TaxID=2011161 RepID=A0A914WFI0_9BILA